MTKLLALDQLKESIAMIMLVRSISCCPISTLKPQPSTTTFESWLSMQ